MPEFDETGVPHNEYEHPDGNKIIETPHGGSLGEKAPDSWLGGPSDVKDSKKVLYEEWKAVLDKQTSGDAKRVVKSSQGEAFDAAQAAGLPKSLIGDLERLGSKSTREKPSLPDERLETQAGLERGQLDQAKENRKEIIGAWKAAGVYPLKDASPTSAEQWRRQALFDLVAVTAAPAVSTNATQAKFTLRLLSEALDESPTALHRIMREVLALTSEQIADLDALLQQATLGDITKTTKVVTDRLEFLDKLESILFDKDKHEKLLERTQLHKVLERHSWIFGEEYAVVASDKGLTRVLEEHRRLLGVEANQTTPVRGTDGNPLIIDLFLSAVAAGLQDKRHLVVELKRPNVTIGMEEVGQIENYALTIMGEAQFKTDGLWWDFWLIGDDMDDKTKAKASQKHLPKGVIMEGDNYRVRVRMWAEALEENRRRMHFYKENLNYRSPADETLEATLDKYLATPLDDTKL